MKTMEDDWSVSSSERIYVPVLTLIVNYPPTVEEQDGIQFETFNLGTCNGESAGMESLLSQRFLALQNVSTFDVERDRGRPPAITSITKDVAGRVCLCDLQGVDDINAVQRLAAAGGAKALFVLQRPSTEPSNQMPVFVMPLEVILKLGAHIYATVTFHWNDGDRSSSPSTDEEISNVPTSTDQGWVEQESTAHDMSLAGDTNALIEPSGRDSEVPVGDRNAPIDLLQMDSSEDDIGQFATNYEEKKAPQKKMHPNTPYVLSQMESSEDNDPLDRKFDDLDIGQFTTGYGEKKAPQEEMNAPGLSSPALYTVSLYESVGSSDHESAFETLQVEAVHATSKLVAHGFAYSVVNVSSYRHVISEKITDFLSQDPNGRVCACRLTDIDDINQVQAIARNKGAVALFVLHKPTAHCELPVFVLPKTVMDKCWSPMRSSAAIFELCDTTPGSREKSFSQSPSRLDPASPPSAVSTGMGDAYSRSNDKFHADQAFFNAVPENKSNAQAASGDGQSSSGGWMYRGVKNFVKAVTGKSKEHFFDSVKGNDLKSNQNAYASVLKKLDRSLPKTGMTGMIVDDAKKFLEKKPWILGHLVAAAYICNSVSSEAGHKLQAAVLSCISNIDIGGLELFKPGSRIKPQPHQVMYTFLTNGMTELTNNIAPGDSVDKRLYKVLVILDSCGLFRKQSQSGVWLSLGKAIDSGFFVRNQGLLEAALDRRHAQTLQLCFQTDLKAFLETALALEDTKSRIQLEPYVHETLLLLIGQEFDNEPNTTNVLSMWICCMTLLDKVTFCNLSQSPVETDQPRVQIISAFFRMASSGNQPNFDTLSQLFSSISLHHYDYRRVREMSMEVLLSKLRTQEVNWQAIRKLLALPIGKLLASPEAEKTTDEFVGRAMLNWSSLEHKLRLLDLLYKKFVGENWISGVPAFEGRMIQHVRHAIDSEQSTVAAVSACLRITANVPGIFLLTDSRTGRTEARKEVAESIVPYFRAQAILRRPDLLQELPDSDDNNAVFYHCLLKRVQDAVLSQCTTIYMAAEFYDSVNKLPSSSLPLQRMAEHVFCTRFNGWKPTSIVDFQLKDKTVLDVMFSKKSVETDTVVDTDLRPFAACRMHVRSIVDRWLGMYRTNYVTRVGLEDVLRSLDSHIWKRFEVYNNIQLPTGSALKQKLDEIRSLESAIQANLSVSVGDQSQHLQHVLREYNCVPEKGVQLHCLFDDYSYLFEENGRDGTVKTLRKMTDDRAVAAELASSNHRMFYLCAYFLIYPSLIFREAVSSKSGHPHSVETLDEAVESARLWLRMIFGSDSLYGEVVSAMKLLKASKLDDALEMEVAALANCVQLQITTIDAENFRVVALLSEMSVPIQHFIHCCEQFGFAIASSDKNFAALRHDVEEFYGNKADENALDKCLDFFRRLCRFLCSDSGLGDSINEREALIAVLPLLQLLAAISKYPELWVYASEMEWFGEEGLKRFYEEYGNVTNVLLGDSASYEMSLLDAMEPAMRLISAIGNLRETTDMLDLFKIFTENQDIVLGLNGGIEQHIRQVHSKLSEIKDWFSNGVDEVAAAHSVYSAAHRSGSYFIAGQDNEVCDKRYTLTLQFTVDTTDASEVRRLQGDALNQFIQQLGMIQNENSGTSAEMQAFVDQFQLISCAAGNVLTMQSVGYEKLSASNFICRAGSDFIEEAGFLLKQSESHMRSFKSWLRSTREIYKVSTLFFTEELRGVYELVQAIGRNEAEPGILTQSLARLKPMWNKEIDERRELDILQGCLAVFRNRSEVQAKSWLIEVSQLLTDIHQEMGAVEDVLAAPCRSNVVLHSLRCRDDEEPQAVLAILQYIFKDRLPLSFEILDGAVPCSVERLTLFLDRVKAFTSCRFVVMSTEKLDSKSLEKLLSFLSDREIESLGVSFHCIQHGDSLVHTSPWVSGKSWDRDSLAALTATSPNIDWNGRVLDDVAISEVTVIASTSCGTGKTRFIREELNKFESSEVDCQAASIVVHEKSSICSLVEALRSKFSGSSGRRALHISFTFMPTSEKQNEKKWLLEMNHFFLSLLVLRSVYDPISATSFSLSGEKWKFFFEMPFSACKTAEDWLVKNIPAVASCGTFLNPTNQFIIDQEARRVCTYLRAFETGTINRKFEGGAKKRIVLVLDCSGSMAGRPFRDAVNNAVGIFDSHVVEGDEFGVILFSNTVYVPVQIQTVGSNTEDLRRQVQGLPFHSGGTAMYQALSNVLHSLSGRDQSIESWVVCLTDGQTGDQDTFFRPQLMATPVNLHVVVVGINLHQNYEQSLSAMCDKYAHAGVTETKGFFVRSDGTTAGIDGAFDVVKSKIPVSQTFDRDGALSDVECRNYIARYLPSSVAPEDMILQSFWIRFLYRRVKVFDQNESFNYNETHDALGSSLMEVMLSEVERLLGENQRRDWLACNHPQLIYDFSNPNAPEFRLICTAPDELDPELLQKLSSLDLPGFHIPTKAGLDRRDFLLLFLSQALEVPLQEVTQCIDDRGFILTLDFTMKLLNIHERVSCRVPCLLEGETGVSKTALTKMYSILRNASLAQRARASTLQDLNEVEQQLLSEGFTLATGTTVYERLRETISDNANGVALRAFNLIHEKASGRSPLFAALPSPNPGPDFVVQEALETLELFGCAGLEETFFEINVDSSLTENDFVRMFEEVRVTAKKLAGSDATVVVFLDEVNTSSVLGLLKEVTVDGTLAGEVLEKNVIIVAACNPPRSQLQSTTRERDLGRDWASGHYQVVKLPASMNKLKWSFGSLTHSQEKEFIYRRIEALHSAMPPFLKASLTEVISHSHEIMRSFAERNILASLHRTRMEETEDIDIEAEARERSRSVVSLRDIQRVFALFEYFSHDMAKDSKETEWSEAEQQRRAMLLAVATVYYLRLDNRSRDEFLSTLMALPTETGQRIGLLDTLTQAMDTVIKESDIPVGIAVTRGLKENVFVTLVCSLSQTPLMIVGPPGSSKTLAVNMVADNATGTDNISPFYGKRPRLSLFHYQCSKQSTSKEISAVFDQAIQRQERFDVTKHRCVVFMDEAGLPEEEKESLKVLHYLLEGHMSAKAKVGFVAISNHVLDAAKSNRCVMLLRQEPDEEEMLSIATGVLFDFREDGRSCAHDVDIDGGLLPAQEFAAGLCASYASLFQASSPLSQLNTFFGLRDFIYFLKAVRLRSISDSTRLHTSVQAIIYAIERNFNGVTAEELRQVSVCFLKWLIPLLQSKDIGMPEASFRDPMMVLKDALSPATSYVGQVNRPRFKLIIDCTEDDSILRLLSIGEVAEVTKRSLYKLSNLSENADLERLRLISGVKFAALQGSFAVLSQTEPINESFYDLFNQRFREITGREGNVTLYANIAVGGISRRSLVQPGFECVIHIRESNMLQIPAPFLNRFEKYRLTLGDVLTSGWSSLGSMAGIVANARKRTAEIAAILGDGKSVFGWIHSRQTLESVFVDMLPHLDKRIWSGGEENALSTFAGGSTMFSSALTEFLEHNTSLRGISAHVDHAVRLAQETLAIDLADYLKLFAHRETEGDVLQESLRSILSSERDDNQVTTILATLIQMVLTRIASCRLIQLATPESIFTNRNNLPPDIVHEYFEHQEHFSLKRLLARSITKNSDHSTLTVVHTRSDQFIHGIPSLPADRGMSSEESETIETVLNLVHDQPHAVVIEHLARLRSEASVRGAIQAWVQHDTRNVFLFLVDMSQEHSLDRANFIRMCVEQHVSPGTGKSFTLLLHYSPSSSLQSRCYPALFLGGWEHVFLDSVGNDSSSFDVDQFIALACRDSDHDSLSLSHDDESTMSVRESIQALLPRVLPHLASQNFFYRHQQGTQDHDAFYRRKSRLDDIMHTMVGDATVGDILCGKFSAMWFEHALLRTTRTASEALLRGTTQLSLSMSIHSVLIQTFQAFLCDSLAETNQWMNLDLIGDSSSNSDVSELFGLVLIGLPVLPFEELVLQRKQSIHSRLMPLPTSRVDAAKVHFPFFYCISAYLDELVESVQATYVREKGPPDAYDDIIIGPPSTAECLRMAMDMLQQDDSHQQILGGGDDATSRNQERRKLAQTVIAFVAANADVARSGAISLFDRYLRQILEWKVGCIANPFTLRWWEGRLAECNGVASILAIHVVARLEQMDLMRVASIASLAESFPLGSLSQEALAENVSIVTSDLLDVVFDSLERAVADNKVRRIAQWSMLISTVSQHAATLAGQSIQDEKLACRLRRLGFFLLLEEMDYAPAADSQWFDNGNNKTKSDYSLAGFLDSTDVAENGSGDRGVLTERVLQRFLSPLWLKTTSVFLEDDLNFLLKSIAVGDFTGPRQQLAVSLVRSASGGKDVDRAYGFSIDALLLINRKFVFCDNLPSFSTDGKRLGVPHFVPEWLRSQSNVEYEATETSPDFSTFFTDYGHSFRDTSLSKVVFDLLLSSFCAEAASATSEELFLGLAREVDSESSLHRKAYTQLSRLRAVGQVKCLRGTPVAAIALSARVICFIAKIAYEIATENSSHVLTGVYSHDARAFVDVLMSQRGTSWQQFFVFSILRLRGEGTLSAALSTHGSLQHLAWCRAWKEGIPTSRNGAIESLQHAEAALAEVTEQENRKAADLRHCPHCRETFIVAAVNCGQFICGQDFHQMNGQANLNGAVLINAHGCGQGFALNEAPPYIPDEAILAPLRARIVDERSKFERCQHGEEMWESARSLSIPPLSHHAKNEHVGESFLPCVQLLSADENQEEQASARRLVGVLWDATGIASRLLLLPDLIEFYLWLHGTFRFLATREYAFKVSMGELMKKERLRERFDPARVHHILALWERVRVGLNTILTETDQKVHWQCEVVSIPFDKVENAQLVSFLSEGLHPTDGNDFLFLVINEAVELYNNFAKKLAAFSGAADEVGDSNTKELQPRFIIRGYGGAVKVGAVAPLSKNELHWVAESSWDSESCVFRQPELKDLINLHDPVALIANPLNHLREKFCFREGDVFSFGESNASSTITLNSGNYFANYQDAQLFDEVQQRSSRLDMRTGDGQIRRTLLDNFHGLDYDRLRAMLEGCRSILDLLWSSEHDSFEAIGLILHDLVDAREDAEQSGQLQAIGFPRLMEPQSRLILSLDMHQFVELVNYAGFQLASEAYLFSNLPLHLTEPLTDDMEHSISTAMRYLGEELGVEAVTKQVEDFSRDVLRFYEIQLLNGASKTNQSLRVFLLENNFCDASDRVFAALPLTVTLRHYISLRQCLHQLKLSLLYCSTDSVTAAATIVKRNDSFTKTTRGRCWLWEDENISSGMGETTESCSDEPPKAARDQLRLWFEQVLPGKEVVDAEIGAAGEEELDDAAMSEANLETAEKLEEVATVATHAFNEGNSRPVDRDTSAARLLQRWWRRELRLIASMNFMEDESESDTDDDDMVAMNVDTQQRDDTERNDESETFDRVVVNHPCRKRSETTAARISPVKVTYGTHEEDILMRKWLDEHKLLQTVGDTLVELGAHCINDIRMLVQECPELLSGLAPLDRVKLKQAVNTDEI